MMTPEEYDIKKEAIRASLKTEYEKILENYHLDAIPEQQKKDDSDTLKQARTECLDCERKHRLQSKELLGTFQKEYETITDENTKLKSGGKKKMSDDKQLSKDDVKNIVKESMIDHQRGTEYDTRMKNIDTKVEELDKRLGKCKDGKCFAEKVSDIEKHVGEISSIKEIVKDIPSIKNELMEYKKTSVKSETCPNCGLPTVYHNDNFYATHCSNCGEHFDSWDEDPNWVPYEKRKK